MRSPQTATSELRVLMALARTDPRKELVEAARAIAREGLDWSRLFALAQRNRVSCLLLRTLRSHLPEVVPESDWATLETAAAQARAVSMAMLATQIGLVERVLRPLDVRHAFIKGAVISQRYYKDPIVRSVSDVDVLVEADRIIEVTHRLLSQGWRICNPSWKEQNLSLFVHYTSVVELQAPDGRRIELHRLVDGSGLVFDARKLLARATTQTLAGREIAALAPEDELLTAVFHHARHGWSCFHWVADLISMIESTGCRLYEYQNDRLLGPTVTASLRLASDIDRVVLDGEPMDAESASPFLPMCLASIDRTTPPEAASPQADPTMMEPDFPMPWQKTRRYQMLFTVGRLRPSLTDLEWWPLPPHFAWLYWIVRPWRILVTRLGAGGMRRS